MIERLANGFQLDLIWFNRRDEVSQKQTADIIHSGFKGPGKDVEYKLGGKQWDANSADIKSYEGRQYLIMKDVHNAN